MTQNELPAFTEETGLIGPATAPIGEWKLEAIEGDSATLDFTASMSNTTEIQAAIAALQALLPNMAEAEKLAYGA